MSKIGRHADHFLPKNGFGLGAGRNWGEIWLAGDHFLPENRSDSCPRTGWGQLALGGSDDY